LRIITASNHLRKRSTETNSLQVDVGNDSQNALRLRQMRIEHFQSCSREGFLQGERSRAAFRPTCASEHFAFTLLVMPIPKLEIDDSADSVLEEHVHCLTTMRADPLAAVHAPKFDDLVTDWTEANASRIKLVITIGQATANAQRIDSQLNGLVDAVIYAIKQIPDPDLRDRLQNSLLKGQPPSTFKRPILAEQLATMSVWPSTLAASGIAALVDIEKKLSALLPFAIEAETNLSRAKQDLVDWKNVGRWRQHIDLSNAHRAAAYGDLLEIPHKNQDAHLRADYADSFFLHDTSRRGLSKLKTSKQMAEEIEAVKNKLGVLEGQLAEALRREAAEAELAALTEQKQKELALLKQQDKDNKAKQKQLQKEIKRKR
jgi:hypothetical protein